MQIQMHGEPKDARSLRRCLGSGLKVHPTASADPLPRSAGLIAALLEIQQVFLCCSLLGRRFSGRLDTLATAAL